MSLRRAAVVLTLALAACSSEKKKDEPAKKDTGVLLDEEKAPARSTPSTPAAPAAEPGKEVTTASGLKYTDLVVGTGAQPRKGQTVVVHYVGTFTDGKQFDSSRERGTPFKFPLGRGKVIPGWDEGVATMKVGGKRRLVVPPELGYGAEGYPGAIPPNATLIFEVELLDLE